MGTISYTVPQAGTDLNSVADPEIATALNTLKTAFNGNIDVVNLSVAAQTALGATGAWVNLTLPGNVTTFTTLPQARTAGDMVQLRGGLLIGSGTISAGVAWATVPGSMIPPAGRTFAVATNITAGLTTRMDVNATTGNLTLSVAGSATQFISLEGLFYPLT